MAYREDQKILEAWLRGEPRSWRNLYSLDGLTLFLSDPKEGTFVLGTTSLTREKFAVAHKRFVKKTPFFKHLFDLSQALQSRVPSSHHLSPWDPSLTSGIPLDSSIGAGVEDLRRPRSHS